MKISIKIWFCFGLVAFFSCKRESGNIELPRPAITHQNNLDVVPPKDLELPASIEDLRRLTDQGEPLSPELLEAAVKYLRNPPQAESANDPKAEYYNQLIDLFLNQKDIQDSLSDIIVAVIDDKSISLIYRDYALQHCYHFWLEERNKQNREKIEKCLLNVIKDRKSPIASTGFLTAARYFMPAVPEGPAGLKVIRFGGRPVSGLPEGTRSTTILSLNQLISEALEASRDNSALAEIRSSALNILIDFRISSVLEPARNILLSPQGSGDLRSTAVKAIGEFGNLTVDSELLSNAAKESDLEKAAVASALRRLSMIKK